MRSVRDGRVGAVDQFVVLARAVPASHLALSVVQPLRPGGTPRGKPG